MEPQAVPSFMMQDLGRSDDSDTVMTVVEFA